MLSQLTIYSPLVPSSELRLIRTHRDSVTEILSYCVFTGEFQTWEEFTEDHLGVRDGHISVAELLKALAKAHPLDIDGCPVR